MSKSGCSKNCHPFKPTLLSSQVPCYLKSGRGHWVSIQKKTLRDPHTPPTPSKEKHQNPPPKAPAEKNCSNPLAPRHLGFTSVSCAMPSFGLSRCCCLQEPLGVFGCLLKVYKKATPKYLLGFKQILIKEVAVFVYSHVVGF